MDTLKEIGAVLGFVAFGGLAVLVFLTFQQARHLRRLREWAGRAPERAAVAAEREAALAGEATEPAIENGEGGAERAQRFSRLRGWLAIRYEDLDRRMPVDPRLLFGGLAAIILGVGIATSGFGVLGSSDSGGDSGHGKGKSEAKPVEVAVLNGTAALGGTGVPGIADRVSGDVRSAGFKVGAVDNAASLAVSVVMFREGAKADASKLADSLTNLLGETAVAPMTPEIEAVAGGADVALVVGQDDQGI